MVGTTVDTELPYSKFEMNSVARFLCILLEFTIDRICVSVYYPIRTLNKELIFSKTKVQKLVTQVASYHLNTCKYLPTYLAVATCTGIACFITTFNFLHFIFIFYL